MKRAGACMRAPAATAERHSTSSSWRRCSTARVPGTSTRPPRGPMQATWPACCASAMTSSRTPSRRIAWCASGIRPSPQTLSRGNDWASTSTTSKPARASVAAQALPAGPAPTTSTSQRSGSVARARFMAEGSSSRRAHRSWRRHRTRAGAPMRQAAITATPVIRPISTKVSWNARSGSACSACKRHSSTLPTRLMPAAPPSWRRKLIVLEPCEIGVVRQPAHRSEVQRRQHEAEADAADRGPERDQPERRRDADRDHHDERQREQHQADHDDAVDRPAVGEPAGERDRQREHEAGRQQHRAGLRRRQVQRDLHEDRHQVGRAEQRHAVDERDAAAHRERAVLEQVESHQRVRAPPLVDDEADHRERAESGAAGSPCRGCRTAARPCRSAATAPRPRRARGRRCRCARRAD